MSSSAFSINLLQPVGRILLLGTIGYAIYRVIEGEYEFEEAIQGAVVGFLGLWFYQDGFAVLGSVSEQLINFFGDHMDRRSMSDQLLAAIQKSAGVQSGGLPSTGEMFSQLWRAGVWGVVSSVIELIFLISDYIIVVSQKVLSKQVILFFPIACGLYPVFPGIFSNLALYAVELSLWRPMLVIIHEITAMVSQDYLANDPTHGLQIVAVELVAIYLIFSIPRTTHGVMNGALSGDLGTSGGFIHASKRVFSAAVGMVRGY